MIEPIQNGENSVSVRQKINLFLQSMKRKTNISIGTSLSGWTENDCDFLCDGTNDEEEFNAAISTLPRSGGKIVVLNGTYTFGSAVKILKNNVTIEGNGLNTVISQSNDYIVDATIFYIESTGFCIKKICTQMKDTIDTSSIFRIGYSRRGEISECLFYVNSTESIVSIGSNVDHISLLKNQVFTSPTCKLININNDGASAVAPSFNIIENNIVNTNTINTSPTYKGEGSISFVSSSGESEVVVSQCSNMISNSGDNVSGFFKTTYSGEYLVATTSCSTETSSYPILYYKRNYNYTGSFDESGAIYQHRDTIAFDAATLRAIPFYFNGVYYFLSTNSNEIRYTSDFDTWNTAYIDENFSGSEWEEVVVGNDMLLAYKPNTNKYYLSSDGINWNSYFFPESYNWCSCAYGDGKFVIISPNNNEYFVSENGIGWASGNFSNSSFSPMKVVYGEQGFVVFLNNYSSYYFMRNGESSWNLRTLGSISSPNSTNSTAVYGNGIYLLITPTNIVYTPEIDGTWTVKNFSIGSVSCCESIPAYGAYAFPSSISGNINQIKFYFPTSVSNNIVRKNILYGQSTMIYIDSGFENAVKGNLFVSNIVCWYNESGAASPAICIYCNQPGSDEFGLINNIFSNNIINYNSDEKESLISPPIGILLSTSGTHSLYSLINGNIIYNCMSGMGLDNISNISINYNVILRGNGLSTDYGSGYNTISGSGTTNSICTNNLTMGKQISFPASTNTVENNKYS